MIACNIVKPRHASDLPGRKRRGVLSQFYDPRPEKFQKLNVDGMLKLKNDLQSINPKIPFAAMLPEGRFISTVKTIVGTVAHGSIIHKQLQQFTSVTSCSTSSPSSAQQTLTGICNCPAAPTTQGQEQAQSNGRISDHSSLVQGESHMADISDLKISSTDGVPVSQDYSQVQERLQSTDNLPFTQVQQQSMQFETFIETLTDEQKQIENATRGQSVNPFWFEQKQNRITASICKDVYSYMNSHRSKIPESLITKITTKGKPQKNVSYLQAKGLNYKSTCKGMIYGIENEPVVASLYKQYLLTLPDVKAVTVQDVGLIVDVDNTVLAASPDRIATVHYQNGNTEIRNVEIKCLESKQDVSPEVAIKDHQKETSFPFTEKNSLYEVKEKHKYWFQSQMQMGITKLPLPDFVIFTNLRFPILVLKVTFSSRWQYEIKPKLLAFHEKYIKDKRLQ